MPKMTRRPTENGVVVLRGTGNNRRVITPEERESFCLGTDEMVREYELYEPDPQKAQAIIDRLNSDAHKESVLYAGRRAQHSMISDNTHIYRNGR